MALKRKTSVEDQKLERAELPTGIYFSTAQSQKKIAYLNFVWHAKTLNLIYWLA